MNFARNRFAQLGVALVTTMILSGQVAWPQAGRSIKLVVPYQAGGGNDILARLLGEQIGRTRGSTVVIENRPEAGRLSALTLWRVPHPTATPC